MNASKENARRARNIAELKVRDLDQAKFLTDFLDAAIAKLPSEAAFARAKERKRARTVQD